MISTSILHNFGVINNLARHHRTFSVMRFNITSLQSQDAHIQIDSLKTHQEDLENKLKSAQEKNTDQHQVIQQYKDNRCIELQQVYEMK